MKSLASLILMVFMCSAVHAADWVMEDIGTEDVGSTNHDAAKGLWTIEAGGKDIWDAADHFRFIYQKISGDFEISFRAVSLVLINNWSKVGPMVRQSNKPESQYTYMLARAQDGNKYFQERMIESDNATGNGGSVEDAGGLPVWLMLSRSGDNYTGLWSPDGNIWNEVGTITLELTDPVLVGIAVTSHETGTLTTVEVDNLIASFDTTAVDPSERLSITWAEIKTHR